MATDDLIGINSIAFDKHDPEEVACICDAALQRGAVVSVVMPVGGILVALPIITAELGTCWECTYRSLFVEDMILDENAPAPAAAALACNHVTHALFCHYVGLAREPTLSTVECDSLAVRIHAVRRHPACSRHQSANLAPWTQEDDAPVRPDLPTSTDLAAIIDAQNSIASRVARLTDPVAGPLLHVGEDDLLQLPLSASRCVIRAVSSMPGRLASHAIVCRGFSARETRNQVVLFALEHVAREVLRSSHRSPLQAVGAGWTPGEAKYRALNHLSLAWAKQSGELDAAEPFSFTDSRGEKMRRYLLDALHAASVHPASFVRTMAPTGLIVARAVSESGAAGWGVGLRETEACVNALAALACDALPLESVGEEVVPALITLRSEAWRDLLACAARHRDGQSFDLNSWNARQLLPFCADLAWIALLRVRCE